MRKDTLARTIHVSLAAFVMLAAMHFYPALHPETLQVEQFSPATLAGENSLSAETDQYNALAKQAGITWLRDKLKWSDIVTGPGSYAWGWYDARFSANRAAGLKTIATLDWLTGADPLAEPGHLTYFDVNDSGKVDALLTFVRAFASRYRPDGRAASVEALELFNEPDTASEWGDHPAEYARLLIQVYATVKAVAPEMAVVNGGVAYECKAGGFVCSFTPAMLDAIQASGQPGFDALNYHWYPGYSLFRDKTLALRSMLTSHGISTPLICTETGVSSVPDEQAQADFTGQVYTEAGQMAHDPAIRLYLLAWYTLRDVDYNDPAYNVFEYYGLVTGPDASGNIRIKPAYYALQRTLHTVASMQVRYRIYLPVGARETPAGW